MLRALKPGFRKPPFPAGSFGVDDLPTGQTPQMAERVALRRHFSSAQEPLPEKGDFASWEELVGSRQVRSGGTLRSVHRAVLGFRFKCTGAEWFTL